MTSLDYRIETFHERMEFTPKSSALKPETTDLSPFKFYIWTQFIIFFMVCSALFWDAIISFYSSFDGKMKNESSQTLRCRILYKGYIPWSDYPKRWLILSYFILFRNVSMTHPSYIIVDSIRETIFRIQRFYDLVDVTSSVIHQYQNIPYIIVDSIRET